MRLIFFFFFIIHLTFSQSVYELDKKADSLHKVEKYEESIQVRTFCLNSFVNKNSNQYATNEIKLTLSSYYLMNDWKQKLQLLENLKRKIESDKLLSDFFLLEFYKNYCFTVGNATGDWVEALEIALQFLYDVENKKVILNIEEQVELFIDIAFIYKKLNNENKTIEYYRKAEEIYFKNGKVESEEAALLYNYLGASYYKVSDFKNSQNYYIRATSIWERSTNGNTINLISSYNSLISNLLEYGDLDNAKFYFTKLKKNIPAVNRITPSFIDKEVLSYFHNQLKINIAERKDNEALVTYHQLYDYFINLIDKEAVLVIFSDATSIYAEYSYRKKEYEKAFSLLDKAEKILIPFSDKKALIDMYSFYSYFWRELKRFDKAHFYIDEAIKLCPKNEYRDLAGLYTSKAMIFFQEKSFHKSEKNFDKAVFYIKKSNNADFYLLSYNNEIAKEYFDIFRETKRRSCLEKSYEGYKLSVSLFNNIYESGLFNTGLEEYVINIRKGLLEIALLNEENNVEIVEMIENTQSKYLCKNFLINKKLKSFVEGTNYLSEINALKSKMTFYLKNSSVDNKFKANQLKNKIDLLERKLKNDFPFLNTFLNPNFNFNQFLLKFKSPVLIYYKTDTSVYGVYVDESNRVTVKRVCDINDLKARVKEYLLKIDNRKPIENISNELYTILIKPFNITNNNLTIVTNTFLNGMPFETLVDNERKFLIQNFRINYSNSLSLLELQNQKHQKRKDITMSVFQPDYTESPYSILPFAEKEALFLHEKFNANYFTKDQATINNFLKYKENTVYHLAMHAKIDYENEFKSKLIFQDKDLYFSDLYAMNLPLDLVVLSACETGLGKNHAGEGVMSLSRAFTFSGVSSTIHSLWETPDKQGFEIMQYFYEYLNDGLPKNEALQKAKIKFLSTVKAPELKHPYYWSGFVLNGNSDALFSKPNNYIMIYVFLSLVIIAFLLIYFLKFRK